MSGEAVYIVGAGRVGTALALLMQKAGEPLAGVWTRTESSARRVSRELGRECAWGPLPGAIGESRMVIVSVRDPEVPAVGGALLDGGLLRSSEAVLHCGGSRPARQALTGVAPAAPVGTFHPLLAVASPQQAARAMPGAFFAVEGDAPARQRAMELAGRLDLRCFEISGEQMGRYHAAAVMASNHAVALWHAAAEVLQEVGLERERASEVLLPLLHSTLENVESLRLAGALTGPVRRGDAATVEAHLEALQHLPHTAALYRAATMQAVHLARRAGDARLEPALERILGVISSTQKWPENCQKDPK